MVNAALPDVPLVAALSGSIYILDLLLYLIYVNHQSEAITNNCKLFADDLKIYWKVTFDSCHLAVDLSSCQADVDQIKEVTGSWGSAAKC